MKTPNNLHIGLEQILPKKSAFSHMFYHLNIKKIKYCKINIKEKTLKISRSQSIHNRFKTSATCIRSHILQTTSLLSPPGQLVHHLSPCWALTLGLLGVWRWADAYGHLRVSFSTFWPPNAPELNLPFEYYYKTWKIFSSTTIWIKTRWYAIHFFKQTTPTFPPKFQHLKFSDSLKPVRQRTTGGF